VGCRGSDDYDSGDGRWSVPGEVDLMAKRSGASAQRVLKLDDVRKVVLWKGCSPRGLTRSFQLFRFAPEGMGRSIQDASRASDLRQEELGQLHLPFWEIAVG